MCASSAFGHASRQGLERTLEGVGRQRRGYATGGQGEAQPTPMLQVTGANIQQVLAGAGAEGKVVVLAVLDTSEGSMAAAQGLQAAALAGVGRENAVIGVVDSAADAGLVASLRVPSVPCVLAVHNGAVVHAITSGLDGDNAMEAFMGDALKAAGMEGGGGAGGGGEAHHDASGKGVRVYESVPLPEKDDDLLEIGVAAVKELEELEGGGKEEVEEVGAGIEGVAKKAMEKVLAAPMPEKPVYEESSDVPIGQQRAESAAYRAAKAKHEEAMAKALVVLGSVSLLRGAVGDALEFVKAAESGYREYVDADAWVTQTRAKVHLQAESAEAKISDEEHAALEAAMEAREATPEQLKTLALSHASRGELEPCVSAALRLVSSDFEYDDQAGRRIVERVLDSLGQSSPLAKKTRRRYMSIRYV